MHATGQTRLHAWSMTSMQGSAITRGIPSTSLLAHYAHTVPTAFGRAATAIQACHGQRSRGPGETRKRKKRDRRQGQKNPTSGGWGQVPRRYWHPSPRKAPQSKTKQVSWLAALTYSLRLPKVSHLSGHRRFLPANSCGGS